MIKKLLVLEIAVLLVSSAIPCLADEGQIQKQKTVFQLFADGFSGFGESKSVAKEDLTLLFQKSHDYIRETFPNQRPKSLRGNPDEIARRRGIR